MGDMRTINDRICVVSALLLALAFSQSTQANAVQPLTFPAAVPGLFLEATAVKLTCTASTGEFKVYGSGLNNGVLLYNNTCPANPAINNVAGTFLLDVFLDHSTSTI